MRGTVDNNNYYTRRSFANAVPSTGGCRRLGRVREEREEEKEEGKCR